MTDDQTTPEADEAPIDEAVIDRVAERTGIDAATIASELVVLNASLIGRHAEFERDHDYVTVDGTRAYRVPQSVWAKLRDEFDVEEALAGAAELAHTEQAQLMFAESVDVDDRFEDDDSGIVVGIDTAEQF